MKEPIWLQKNVILAFHAMLIVDQGGLYGLRDEGLLDSALSRPLNVFLYKKSADLYELAAIYAVAIIKNHPFVDGNKRVAFVAMKLFLLRNDINLNFPKEESINKFFNLAAGLMDENELALWIKSL